MREKKRRREKSEREERGKNKHFFYQFAVVWFYIPILIVART